MDGKVYYDSTRKMFSVKAKDRKTGRERVLLKSRMLAVFDPRLVVNESAVQRVVNRHEKTGKWKKEVVATIRGDIGVPTNPDYVTGRPVRYNIKDENTRHSFVDAITGEPVTEGRIAHFNVIEVNGRHVPQVLIQS